MSRKNGKDKGEKNTRRIKAVPGAKGPFDRVRGPFKDPDKNTDALIQAVLQGDMTRLDFVIAAGADVTRTDAAGLTPLHHAAQAGHVAAMEKIVRAGADVNAQQKGRVRDGTKTFETPLHIAATHAPDKDAAIVCLLALGAKADMLDDQGRTALHLAAEKAGAGAITALIKAGAPIEAKDKAGKTPLLHACAGARENIEALLFERADVFAADLEGNTCLHIAAAQKDAGLAQILLGTPAARLVSAQNTHGQTPLFAAAREGHAVLCENLIGLGANAQTSDLAGMTPLKEALRAGRYDIADLLIDAGASMDKVTPPERASAMTMAARVGDMAMLDYLFKRGANPDAPDSEGVTPLMIACMASRRDVMDKLLDAGANAALRDNAGRNVLHHLTHAAKKSDVERLIAGGADIHARDIIDRTPLLSALANGIDVAASTLLTAGSNPSGHDKLGYTALTLALTHHRAGLAEALIRKGADVTEESKAGGQTPLHLACSAGFTRIAQDILAKGANVNARDSNGGTPLHHVAGSMQGTMEVARLLIDKGADPLLQNNAQSTPYDMAYGTGKHAMVELFKKELAKAKKTYNPKPIPYIPPWGY